MANKYDMRLENEKNILKTAIQQGITSRAELSALTGINKVTTSSVVSKLLEEGLLIELNEEEIGELDAEETKSVGKKVIPLKFHAHAGLSLSIDIRQKSIHTLLTYLNGEEVHYLVKNGLLVDKENVLGYLLEIIDEIKQNIPKTDYGIIGVTLAIHGPVYHDQIVYTPSYDIDQVDLKNALSEHLSYPVFLENEANLAALGEYTFHSEYSELISISSNLGIGAGCVNNGEMEIGAHGSFGEIGHQIIEIDGKPCKCGSSGCLELYASDMVIFELLAKKKNLHFADEKILRDYYLNKDKETLEIIEEAMKYLGAGISSTIAHLDPQVVVLNSSLFREIPALLSILNRYLPSRLTKEIQILNSDLGSRAVLLGGFAWNIRNFLGIPRVKF